MLIKGCCVFVYLPVWVCCTFIRVSVHISVCCTCTVSVCCTSISISVCWTCIIVLYLYPCAVPVSMCCICIPPVYHCICTCISVLYPPRYLGGGLYVPVSVCCIHWYLGGGLYVPVSVCCIHWYLGGGLYLYQCAVSTGIWAVGWPLPHRWEWPGLVAAGPPAHQDSRSGSRDLLKQTGCYWNIKARGPNHSKRFEVRGVRICPPQLRCFLRLPRGSGLTRVLLLCTLLYTVRRSFVLVFTCIKLLFFKCQNE